MRRFPTGVALLSTGRGDNTVAMTINTLISVSLSPPQLLVSVARRARAHSVLVSTRRFALNLLAGEHDEIARLFSSATKPTGKALDAYLVRSDGIDPAHDVLPGALSSLSCRVEDVYPGGDHSLFLARVIDVRPGEADRRPLLFLEGDLRGAPPAVSPTVRAVRGAIGVDTDTPEAVARATRELIGKVTEANSLLREDLISAFFTSTPDLTSELPALAASEAGWEGVPMLCAAEMPVPTAMPRVVRVLVHAVWHRPKTAVRHVYLRGTAPTRPDPLSA